MLVVALTYDNDFQALTLEQWREFSDLWPAAKGRQQSSFYHYSTETQRMTEEECVKLQEIGLKLDIKGVDGTMLTKMKGNPAKSWSYAEKIQPEDLIAGTAVQITLPDVGLLLIDEVTWREDECTEVIQGMLDEGWRIIAVCPPNAQRRPDYILGRRKHRD